MGDFFADLLPTTQNGRGSGAFKEDAVLPGSPAGSDAVGGAPKAAVAPPPGAPMVRPCRPGSAPPSPRGRLQLGAEAGWGPALCPGRG